MGNSRFIKFAMNEFDWKTFGETHPAPFGADVEEHNSMRVL